MVLRGLRADVEPLGDLTVRGALGQQLKDFELTLCQRPRAPLSIVPAPLDRSLWSPEIIVDDAKVVSRELGLLRPRSRRGAPWCRPMGRKPSRACRTSIRARSRPQVPALAPRTATGSRLCLPFLPLISARTLRPVRLHPHPIAVETPRSLYAFASSDSRSIVATGVRPVENAQFPWSATARLSPNGMRARWDRRWGRSR